MSVAADAAAYPKGARVSARIGSNVGCPTYRSERIDSHHRIDTFRSGSWVMNRWLSGSARRLDEQGAARTFVWTGGEEGTKVLAYFTLAPHRVTSMSGSEYSIPAVLLARLALDLSIQGRGLGSQLLVDALERASYALGRSARGVIVVDAVNREAAGFYEHFGFRQVAGNPFRLYRSASDVARSLGVA